MVTEQEQDEIAAFSHREYVQELCERLRTSTSQEHICELLSEATAVDEGEERRYSPEEVKLWYDYYMKTGAPFPEIQINIVKDLANFVRVPTMPLREAIDNYLYHNPDSSLCKIANTLNWTGKVSTRTSEYSLTRNLGYRPFESIRFKPYIAYHKAVAIALAINVPPIELHL